MKKILLFLTAIMTAVSALAKTVSPAADPELFNRKNNKVKQYIGIMPPNVKTIAFIATGSYPGAPQHKKGIELLRQAGYKIKVMPHAFARQKGKNHAPLQGKLADFYAAWNDPEVDMIFSIRGGMGSEDVLDALDWSKLKKRPELYFQGYSDVTLVVCALLAKDNGHPIAGVMSGSLPAITRDAVDAMRKINHGQELGPIKVKTIVNGSCEGYPLGGSLWKLCRLPGKDYCPDTTGKIIFIEASKVTPDMVRKKLYELKEKKFFDKAAGVVFGRFASCNPQKKLDEVIREFAPKLGIPVVADYPFGHIPQCYSIDFKRKVIIKNGTVTFPATEKY